MDKGDFLLSNSNDPKEGDFKFSFAISLHKTQFEAIASTDDNVGGKMKKMSSMGFDGVELAIRDPSDIDILELERELRFANLKASALSTGQAYLEEGLSLSHPDSEIRKAAIKRIRGHIRFASQLEALVVIGLIRGNLLKDIPRKDSIDLLKESLTTCLGYAEKEGVFLALEPLNRYECNFINNVPEGVAFVEEMGHHHLKIMVDTFHMNIEDKNFRESIILSAPWLVHVHFADSNRRFPGAGHINFKEITDTLKDIEYRGFISGEMLPEPTEVEAMKSFLAFMQHCK